MTGRGSTYTVRFSDAAVRTIEQIPTRDRERIVSKVAALVADPRPRGARKLQGSEGDLWRIRVGNYRVLYAIEDDVLLVTVVKVGHRREVYRSV